MWPRSLAAGVRKDSDDKIVDQLERILSSNVFRQADRLKAISEFHG